MKKLITALVVFAVFVAAAVMASSAVKCADFVLIPIQPSLYDILAVRDLVDMVKQQMEAANVVTKLV